MPAKTRTPAQNEYLQAQISELNLKGSNQAAIAAKLGIMQQMVSYYIRKIESALKKRTYTDRELARQRELDTIDLLLRQLWKAQARLEKRRPDSLDEQLQIDAAITRNGMAILKYTEARCKLLGLHDTSDLYTAPEAENTESFTPDEIADMIAAMARHGLPGHEEVQDEELEDEGDELEDDECEEEELEDEEAMAPEDDVDSGDKASQQSGKRGKGSKNLEVNS